MNFLPIPRTIIDMNTFRNPKALKVYIWCWHKLRYQFGKVKIVFETGSATIDTGQFVTGRFSGASELGLCPSTFRNLLKVLKEDNLILIKASKHYSVITVRSAKEYYAEARMNGQPKDSDKTQTNKETFPSKGRKLTGYEERLKEMHKNANYERNDNV